MPPWWSRSLLPGLYSKAVTSLSGWHAGRDASASAAQRVATLAGFYIGLQSYLSFSEMRWQIAVITVVGVYRCTTQSPSLATALGKCKSRSSLYYSGLFEADAWKTCVLLNATLSEHRRKLFIKYFPSSGRGKGASNPGEGRCCLVLPCG